MLRKTCGQRSARPGLGAKCQPIMGTKLIDSSPPATATSVVPLATDWLARASACRPEAQKRLTVMALVATGRPAPSATWRAMLRPCAPSGMAQPRMRSSTRAGSRPGALAIASRTAVMASSSGGVSRRPPRGALPTAVRAAETMTASRIGWLLVWFSCGGVCRS